MDPKFKKALEIFKESMIAQQLLEIYNGPASQEWPASSVDQDKSIQDRLKMLSIELQQWIILKSQEVDEYEGDDLIRLEGEAVGCMYALRELQKHVGELVEN